MYGNFVFFDSTISHIGFLLLALAVNTEQSIESLVFYLIQYTITNLNVFFILLAFGYIINSILHNRVNADSYNSDINFIYQLKGQFLSNPLLSVSLAISLFSMAGIPPLIGFFGKQSVLYSAVSNGYFFMSFIAILVSVISAYYYLKIIRILHTKSSSLTSTLSLLFGSSLNGTKASDEKDYTDKNFGTSIPQAPKGIARGESFKYKLTLTNSHSFIIAILTLIILFFVIKPSIILNSIVLLSLSLFNG